MRRKKILLVDDDGVFVKAMSTKLRAKGPEVITVEHGHAVLSALRQGNLTSSCSTSIFLLTSATAAEFPGTAF